MLAAIAIALVAWLFEGRIGWPIDAVVIAVIVGCNGVLDSYGAERLPIAKQLIAGADRAYSFVLPPGALARGVARHLGPFILGLDAVQEGFRTTLEEVGLKYRQGPISEDQSGGARIRAGDRAPDATVVTAGTLCTASLFDVMRDTH